MIKIIKKLLASVIICLLSIPYCIGYIVAWISNDKTAEEYGEAYRDFINIIWNIF